MLSDAYASDVDHATAMCRPMEPDLEPGISLALDWPGACEVGCYPDWPSVLDRLARLPLQSCRIEVRQDEADETSVYVQYQPTRCEIVAHTGRQEAC